MLGTVGPGPPRDVEEGQRVAQRRCLVRQLHDFGACRVQRGNRGGHIGNGVAEDVHRDHDSSPAPLAHDVGGTGGTQLDVHELGSKGDGFRQNPLPVFFGAVVVLTMLAAESCDPRLIWDESEEGA